ncbi:MAG: type III glutamate--ammonia ligase [Planctomycetia bacterium]|nr:type III glutamate--ammonia ligase [Planctomycetia bacterium]
MSLEQKAKELGIQYFLISYCDLLGASRAKLVPAAAIGAMEKNGAGFAGFASWLDMTPADPDVLAVPDADSLTVLPWKPEVGWLAADLWAQGAPVAQAPRNVLKHSLAKAAERGYEFRTGVEPEFMLLTPDGEAIGDARDCAMKPCYDQQALLRRYDLITEICDGLLKLGWEPYQNDHEDANGQFEINWKYSHALETADRQTFFKFMVKALAEKHGLRATFMPKPFTQLTGNGCHVHLSLWDRARGTNLFHDAHGELGLSSLAYGFLAGVLHSADALAAISNPTINSYRRLHASTTTSGATWSPQTISYGGNNRTHMIRIPDAGRFEFRLADGAANPYLLAAGLLEAGLDGIDARRPLGKRVDRNAYDLPAAEGELKPLPGNLLDALRALGASGVLREGLGERAVAGYLKLKQAEWRNYSTQVTPWEREHTLDC